MVQRFPAKYQNGFEPTLHRTKLSPLNVRVPSTILTCIMGDLFSPGVLPDWQERVGYVIGNTPEHTYLLLTKRPDLYNPGMWVDVPDYGAPPDTARFWLGVSVESGAVEHYRRIGQLRRVDVAHRFVSFEPLTDGIDLLPQHLKGIEWTIIGAMTGPGAVKPERRWVDNIIEAATAAGVPLFCKDNLIAYWPDLAQYRALPYLESQP
jgi:protein gp37